MEGVELRRKIMHLKDARRRELRNGEAPAVVDNRLHFHAEEQGIPAVLVWDMQIAHRRSQHDYRRDQ